MRTLLLVLILIPANAYWIIQMERVRRGPYVTSISLFANVIFVLGVLVGLNALLRRFWPKRAFKAGELLVVYSLLSVASGVAGMDFMQVLMMILGHATHFATPENRWEEIFFRYLPPWLIVRDKEALRHYYEGNSTLYLPEHYRAWLVPGLSWLAFLSALLLVMLCLNLLVRRQWIEKERLTFPVTYLPLAMTQDAPHFFRNRVMWSGFAVSFGLGLLNGLHFLYPIVPQVNITKYDLADYLSTKPWNAVRWMPVYFYPFALGLGFVLPIDLLFSCWFFYLFWKGQLVLTRAFAWDVHPQFPYISQQALGACVGFSAYLAYISRHHLREVVRSVIGQPFRKRAGDWGPEAEEGGPTSTDKGLYRFAALGLLFGGGFLLFFSQVARMSLGIALLFFLLYYTVSFVITRIRAELGPPVHDFHRMGPEIMITMSFGTQNLRGEDLGVMALYWWFNRAYRGHPMAHQIEGFKLAHQTRTNPWLLTWGLWLAGILGSAAAMWAYLHLGYQLGTAAKFASGYGYGWQNYGALRTWLEIPTEPNAGATVALGVGLAFSLFLLLMRLRFLGWPFHPIGYAISSSWSINLVWFPLFLSWLIKLAAVRYGGLRLYRQMLPFFLGLILGDCLIGSFWSVVGVILGIPTYSFWGA
ncbi:MAG TPA: hypothetical protein EYP85_04555 [Armatimonadetes bacterium]|nr:hypothetical protein [Armatimonadota bacterium]